MILTPKELKIKCQKYWHAQHVQRSFLNKTTLFPLTIAKIRLSARELSTEFAMIREGFQSLHNQSKAIKGWGYSLNYSAIQHRQLGQQNIPESICFETLADFLKFTGCQDSYQQFSHAATLILNTLPTLSDWAALHTETISEYQKEWPKLLSVATFLYAHPTEKGYLRELPIPDIDSKFIEQHKRALSDILDIILPENRINQTIVGLQSHGFERRYGFKYPEPLIRFRILDAKLIQNQLSDLSIPLADFQKLNFPCKTVFITENKINGLSFPSIEDAIIVFGLGYGIQSLADIFWLKDKDIYYWGDLDTHGFAMLSQLRSYYPQVKNLLMDERTLQQFKAMAVAEPEDKRCLAILPHLNEKEQKLYQALCNNQYGINTRIEQERIHFQYLQKVLRQLFITLT